MASDSPGPSDLVKENLELRRRVREAEAAVQQLRASQMITDRLASIGMLVASVAHEINNPLAYVVANLDYLAQHVSPSQATGEHSPYDEAGSVVAEAQEGAQRIRCIVRDLKAFSRSDEGERGPVDLHRLLDSSANMAWNEIRHRARLSKDYAAEVLCVAGTKSRLGQLFVNLLVNAAQAIPEGSADTQRIRLVTRRAGPDEVMVEVMDSGKGLAPEILEQLFTPFFTTKPKGLGTGLGLSICQSIVGQHGGRIEAESTPNEGATFRVYLPRCEPQQAQTVEENVPAAAARGRVLVLDDEPLVGAALRRIIGRRHHVECVTKPAEALARIDSGPAYDVILCDLMMPAMAGATFYAELERRRPALASRVIFLTGGAFTAAAEAFLGTLPRPSIAKPFDSQRILEVIDELLARRGEPLSPPEETPPCGPRG